MRQHSLGARLRDRRGLISLEYAVLAAAVATALFAAAGTVQQHMARPFDQMESSAIGSGATIRFNPF